MIQLSPQIALALISPEMPRLVNFIIFAAILYYFLHKPVIQFLRQRVQKIRTDLEQAQAERESARAKLQEIESRLIHLGHEIAELKTRAIAEAQAEETRLQASAAAEAEKLRALAVREIQSATEAAKLELKVFAAVKAVELAKNLIQREVTDADHHRLIERFTEQIEEARP
jgi:F-type H+-transporting ATPase subunit b